MPVIESIRVDRPVDQMGAWKTLPEPVPFRLTRPRLRLLLNRDYILGLTQNISSVHPTTTRLLNTHYPRTCIY